MPYYAAKVWLKSQDACKLTDELRQKISEYLRQECTVIDSAGKEQSEIALLRSWQRYLITGNLLFCPIRLQTLCRLEQHIIFSAHLISLTNKDPLAYCGK